MSNRCFGEFFKGNSVHKKYNITLWRRGRKEHASKTGRSTSLYGLHGNP